MAQRARRRGVHPQIPSGVHAQLSIHGRGGSPGRYAAGHSHRPSAGKEWGVKPDRIGVLGFSAGGARRRWPISVSIAASRNRPIRLSSRAAGPISSAWSIRAGSGHGHHRPKDAAPAFLTGAGKDDASHAVQTVEFYNSLFKARRSGRAAHLLARRPRQGDQPSRWHPIWNLACPVSGVAGRSGRLKKNGDPIQRTALVGNAVGNGPQQVL